MSELRQCGRSGCGKFLRKDNTKGVCSTGCLSEEAPRHARHGGTKGFHRSTNSTNEAPAPVAATAPRGERSALEKFRIVCDALGRDAEAELEHLAAQWLRGLAEKVAP